MSDLLGTECQGNDYNFMTLSHIFQAHKGGLLYSVFYFSSLWFFRMNSLSFPIYGRT